jgi:hypothetical protein
MSKKAKAVPKAPKRAPKVSAKPAKPKIGRPSLYRPEYCKRIVELGKQGKTKSQMAAALDIALSTFNAWLDAHEEFADSYARADTQARAFMEGLAERGVTAELDNALWRPEFFRPIVGDPVKLAEDCDRVVVAVNPSGVGGAEDKRSDMVGIVVCGRLRGEKRYRVLADRTMRGSPQEWAGTVCRTFSDFKAD